MALSFNELSPDQLTIMQDAIKSELATSGRPCLVKLIVMTLKL